MKLFISALCEEREFQEYFRETTTSLFVLRTTNKDRRRLRNTDAQYVVAQMSGGELQELFTCSDSSDVLDAAFEIITTAHKPATSIEEISVADDVLRYAYIMSPHDIIELQPPTAAAYA